MKVQGALAVIPDDRREALRQASVLIDLEIEYDGAAMDHGVLMDVSRTGVRFRSIRKYGNNRLVLLHPPVNSGLNTAQVNIVRVRDLEQPDCIVYEYGARFMEDTSIHRHAWFLTLRQSEG